MQLQPDTRRRRLAGALALILAAAACGGGSDTPVAVPPVVPPVVPPAQPAVDSAAPATLQLPDTIRFHVVHQAIVPPVRLLDLRGRALDPETVQWRVENDSVVLVWKPSSGPTSLVVRAPGATRVIATVPRVQGAALVDTAWAVWSPIYERLWLVTGRHSLVVGQARQLAPVLIDTADAMLPLPDSIRARATWRSSRPEVASVDERGRVTALGRGNAVIEATIPSLGFRDTTLVGVTAPAELAVTTWAPAVGDRDMLASPDGRTFYAQARAFRGSTVQALSAAGALLWERPTQASSPLRSVARDGTLYYQGVGLHAVRPDGTELWTAPCSGPVALGADDTVYCADTGSVRAISPAGVERWRVARPNVERLVVAGRDRVYALDRVFPGGTTVTAFSPSGTVLWRRPTRQDYLLSVAADADGALYVSYGGWWTEAIAPDGTVRWELPGVRGELAVGPDRTLIVSREYGLVTAVRLADGATRWSTRDFTVGHGTPYVTGSGRLYLASDCWVHTLDGRTGEVFGRTTEQICGSDILRHLLLPGRLYIGNRYYELPSADDRPGSEWSQFGADASRSWRAQRD